MQNAEVVGKVTDNCKKNLPENPVATQRNPETTISNLKRTYWCGSVFTLRQILIKFHIYCAQMWHTLVGVHFDGLTADGSGHAVHEANQGFSCAPKLAVHTSALRGAEAASLRFGLTLPLVYSWLSVVQGTANQGVPRMLRHASA